MTNIPDPIEQNTSQLKQTLQPSLNETIAEILHYEPRFQRTRWLHEGIVIDRFFDQFVPMQYEQGFAWRCQVVGKGQEERIISFDNKPKEDQKIIVANAEVLLELFQKTDPGQLDIMRQAGKSIVDSQTIDLKELLAKDIHALSDRMGRQHHEDWLAQFQADIKSGKRSDIDHPGAKPFDELCELQLEIMKVQTWANWRVLASLTDDEYAMVRSFAQKHANSSGTQI
jgi:hypothetical protein